jgi:hypothetical protein
VASRAEEKKRLKAEREERERQEQEKSQKRKKRLRIIVGAAVVVVAAIVAFAVLSGGSEKKTSPAEAGLDISPGPWGPGNQGVAKRAADLGFPGLSEQIFHIHAHLEVYVNGKKQTIPNGIGADQEEQTLTALHTHDTEGVVHIEADRQFPFTVGQFFTIWGVKFTPTQLGAYRPGNGLVLETWVNGRKVPNGPGHVMKSHDRIVVGFGKPDSFPKKTNFKFKPGE